MSSSPDRLKVASTNYSLFFFFFIQFTGACNISVPLSGSEFGQEKIVATELITVEGFSRISASVAVQQEASFVLVAYDNYIEKVRYFRCSEESEPHAINSN